MTPQQKKKAKSPYQKFKKTPFKYNSTPLNREHEGIPTTRENLRRWETRLFGGLISKKAGALRDGELIKP